MSERASKPAPRRRWFRFGLGGLFLAVTAVACVFGYGANWVARRQAFLARQSQAHERYTWWTAPVATGTRRPPALLRLFDEPGVAHVRVLLEGPSASELTKADRRKLAEARALFPEADLTTLHVTKTDAGNHMSEEVPPEE